MSKHTGAIKGWGVVELCTMIMTSGWRRLNLETPSVICSRCLRNGGREEE